MKMSSRPKAELSAAAEGPVLGAGAESPESRNHCAQAPQISRSRGMKQPPQCLGSRFCPAETNSFLPPGKASTS